MATGTATKTKAGFSCPCPKCGATEGLVVRVHDLTLECTECSEEVQVRDLQKMVEAATRLIRWLDHGVDVDA